MVSVRLQWPRVVKTVETVCFEIMREVVRVNRAYAADKFNVYAATNIVEALESDQSDMLAELELLLVNRLTFTLSLISPQNLMVTM